MEDVLLMPGVREVMLQMLGMRAVQMLRCTDRRLRAELPMIPAGCKGNVNEMLAEAAKKGDMGLCRLARDWGATDFNRMLACAAKGGHEGLCRLAVDWGSHGF